MSDVCMITPDEAAAKALKRFERDCRAWAAALFASSCGSAGERPQAYSIPLHPPTEKQAMADRNAARAWARTWHSSPLAGDVQWTSRNWGSIGQQTIPVRLTLESPSDIARAAGAGALWERMSERTLRLAERYSERWSKACPSTDPDALVAAVRAVAGRCCELEERDWEMLLLALDWLVDNQDATYFVRQLPIRGIDTKWMEGHQGLVKPLRRALTGRDPQFARQAGQFRVHVLDERLAPGDLTDLALSVEQLGRWPRLPDCVLICENMVNVLALPPLPGVIAIHGGGFAVGELASVPWLSHVPLLYWGDLDSNGFAILNQLRSHHGHVTSLMMDAPTLDRYRDLCVEEPTPSKATCSHLTPSEQEALALVLAGDESCNLRTLRLEQERIEWAWACEQIKRRVEYTAPRNERPEE